MENWHAVLSKLNSCMYSLLLIVSLFSIFFGS
jgi:hypothetical protein